MSEPQVRKLDGDLKNLVTKHVITGYSIKGNTVIVYVSDSYDEELIKKLESKYAKFTFTVKKIGNVRAL